MKLRFAQVEKTEDIKHQSGEAYITLRTEVSRGEILDLYKTLSTDDFTRAIQMQERVWKLLVRGWSLETEDGEKIDASFANFKRLHEEPARWVNDVVQAQFLKVSPPEEAVKNEPETLSEDIA